jgi:hypothetical protein
MENFPYRGYEVLRNILAGECWESSSYLGGGAMNSGHQQLAYNFIRLRRAIFGKLGISQPQQEIVVAWEGRQDWTLQDEGPIPALGVFTLELVEQRVFQFA